MRRFLLSVFTLLSFTVASVAQSDNFEGFEGWDMSTINWLPEGWSTKNSSEEIAQLNDGAFIWHVGKQEGTIPSAPEGSCYAMIWYAYKYDENNKKIDLPQDEWMISPSYIVSNGSTLSFSVGYSPLFLFDLNNANVDWEKPDFKNRKPSTTLKIHIRSNGGEWTLLKDIYDDWAETPFKTLFENHFSAEFFRYTFDLSQYAGTEVQIAFQFVGMYGNTMEVDEFNVTEATLGVEKIGNNDRVRPIAYVENGNIVIASCGTKSVDIYQANAGLVSSVALDGNTIINGAGLSKGIYLLKFDDGTVLKVVK